jgi:hypothetical protein
LTETVELPFFLFIYPPSTKKRNNIRQQHTTNNLSAAVNLLFFIAALFSLLFVGLLLDVLASATDLLPKTTAGHILLTL